MSSSLEKLVSNLPVDKLVYTTKEFNENVMLMARKGVYHMTIWLALRGLVSKSFLL